MQMNSELYFEAKKYISARRASQISGYNSDYIGQLCRKEKLDCRLVGRSWFVSEESLLQHQKSSSEKPRGIIYFPGSPSTSKHEPVVVQASISLPSVFDERVRRAISYIAIVPAIACIVFVAMMTYNPTTQIRVAEFAENTITFNRNLVAHVASDVTRYVALVEESSATSPMGKTAYFTDRTLGMFARFLNTTALGTYKTLSRIFNTNTSQTLVVRDTTHLDTVVTGEKNNFGIAVVPSSGDQATDEKTKQKIKNAFSDETRVIPDETGTSGVIQPVFKHTQDGGDYVYVLVPVDDGVSRAPGD